LYELETQIRLATELKYLDEAAVKEFMQAAREVGKLLNGLLGSLKSQLTTDN
jgi:four helix bundle protein